MKTLCIKVDGRLYPVARGEQPHLEEIVKNYRSQQFRKAILLARENEARANPDKPIRPYSGFENFVLRNIGEPVYVDRLPTHTGKF